MDQRLKGWPSLVGRVVAVWTTKSSSSGLSRRGRPAHPTAPTINTANQHGQSTSLRVDRSLTARLFLAGLLAEERQHAQISFGGICSDSHPGEAAGRDAQGIAEGRSRRHARRLRRNDPGTAGPQTDLHPAGLPGVIEELSYT